MAFAFLFYLLCDVTECPPPLVHHSCRNPSPSLKVFQGGTSSASSSSLFPFSISPSESRFARSHSSKHAAHGEGDKSTTFAPRVTTSIGDIQGKFIESRDGRRIAAFEGIPYAIPPINSLRFRNPVPANSWKGQLMVANKTSMDCLQLDFSRMLTVRGAEDCLYINVYSNHASVTEPSTNIKCTTSPLLPVIVFIHGGGWLSSSGTNYGPRYLLDRDVSLVTFNYRLGVLGFLSTGNEAGRGNFALHDQSLALKWVSDHISAFGGNGKMITLNEESTGAGSVALHMLSPTTTKYTPSIYGAILLSGGSMNHWSITNDTIDNTKALAKRMHYAFVVEILISLSVSSCISGQYQLLVDFSLALLSSRQLTTPQHSSQNLL